MTSLVIPTAALDDGGEGGVAHVLPCRINFDGPAKVNTYFDAQDVSKLPGKLPGEHMAFFRGRELRGFKFDRPHGTAVLYCVPRVASIQGKGGKPTQVALSQLPAHQRNLDDSMEEAALDTTAASVPASSASGREGDAAGMDEDDLDAAFSDDDSDAEHNARFCKTSSSNGTLASPMPSATAAPTKELRLEASRSIGTVMQWKLEDAPSADDPFTKAASWMRIARAVHGCERARADQKPDAKAIERAQFRTDFDELLAKVEAAAVPWAVGAAT